MATKPIPEINFEKEEITPEIAAQYLQLNQKNNRPISQSNVDSIVDAINDGRLATVTHEAIAFDWDGNLIDGQHRLTAIVKSGKTLTLLVAYNCNPETIYKVNIGKNRTSSDFFTMAFKDKYGKSPVNALYITSITSAMIQGTTSKIPDRDDVWPYAIKHYKLITKTKQALTNPNKLISTNVIAAFAKAIQFFDEETINPLMERLRTEMWASTSDPMKALYVRLLKDKVRESRSHILSKLDKYSLAVAAIRACLMKENRHRLEGTSQDWGESDADFRILAILKTKNEKEEEKKKTAKV